jgi:hypothetical protein
VASSIRTILRIAPCETTTTNSPSGLTTCRTRACPDRNPDTLGTARLEDLRPLACNLEGFLAKPLVARQTQTCAWHCPAIQQFSVPLAAWRCIYWFPSSCAWNVLPAKSLSDQKHPLGTPFVTIETHLATNLSDEPPERSFRSVPGLLGNTGLAPYITSTPNLSVQSLQATPWPVSRQGSTRDLTWYNADDHQTSFRTPRALLRTLWPPERPYLADRSLASG